MFMHFFLYSHINCTPELIGHYYWVERTYNLVEVKLSRLCLSDYRLLRTLFLVVYLWCFERR